MKKIIHKRLKTSSIGQLISVYEYYKENINAVDYEVKHGSYQEFWENGNYRIKSYYVDNKLEGEYLQYYDNGTLGIKCHYKNGKKEGKYILYDENEKIKTIINYKNGNKNGKETEFYRSGNLMKNRFFSDNEFLYSEYYKDGEYEQKQKEKKEKIINDISDDSKKREKEHEDYVFNL